MRQQRQFSNSNYGERLCTMLMFLLPCLQVTKAQYPYAAQLAGQTYGYNQVQQEQQQLLQPHQPAAYYYYMDQQQSYANTQQHPTGYSVWSGAPIVVGDSPADNDLELEQRTARGYIHNNIYYPQQEATTRATNHNYNKRPSGYYYSEIDEQSTEQQPQQADVALKQRELLTAAEARRQDDNVVHIGGNRNAQHNYYQAAQPLQRDFEAKYAKHYANYLSKYPQRLQPFYGNGQTSFVDK